MKSIIFSDKVPMSIRVWYYFSALYSCFFLNHNGEALAFLFILSIYTPLMGFVKILANVIIGVFSLSYLSSLPLNSKQYLHSS